MCAVLQYASVSGGILEACTHSTSSRNYTGWIALFFCHANIYLQVHDGRKNVMLICEKHLHCRVAPKPNHVSECRTNGGTLFFDHSNKLALAGALINCLKSNPACDPSFLVYEFIFVLFVCIQSELVSLQKQCGLSQRRIQTWFRHRRNQDKPTNTKKFCEAS